MDPITAEMVRAALIYDAETGVFTRRIDADRWKAGKVVGSIDASGYLVTSVCGKKVYLHRAAWLYMTGSWPEHDIDHFDTCRSNNKWLNLRASTRRMNCENRRASRKDRKHGTLIGTKRHRLRWQARIAAGGVDRFIGSFKTEAEAHAAYVIAKRELHEGCTL